MNPVRRTYHIACAATLILACVAGAQVASSVDAAPVVPPRSSSVSYSSPAPSSATAVSKLRGALARSSFGSSNASSGVFVVPGQEISVEDLAAINEDVNVMTRIFEKKLRQANLLPQANPYPIFVGAGHRSPWATSSDGPRNMYLQGYGVLFMMDVDFPLAPGPETKEAEEPAQAKSDVDPVWASTRQEIYEPQRLDQLENPYESKPPYSAERVENLKTTIIDTLVHAANIRALTSDESVIVTITGSPVSQVKPAGAITIPGTGQIVVKGKNDELTVVEGPLAENAPTVLTIRAKVADIKACAQGQLGEQQFRQRVQVLSHPMLRSATDFSGTTLVAPGGRSSGSLR